MSPSRARLEALALRLGVDPTDIEVCTTTRRWARFGSRPSAPHDQRTAPTYIFGAICP